MPSGSYADVVSVSTANTWTAAQTFAPSPTLGSEILTNGGFDTDLSGWDLEGNDGDWSCVSGAAVHTPGSFAEIFQDVTLTVPGWHKFEIIVSGMIAGSYYFSNNYNPEFNVTLTANGTASLTVYLTHASDSIFIGVDNAFDGRIESVSLRAAAYDSALIANSPNGNRLLEVKPNSVEIDTTRLVLPNLPTSDPGGNAAWLHNNQVTVGASSNIDHATLDNLDYTTANHTGFAGVNVPNTFTDVQTFNVAPIMPNVPLIERKNVFLDLNAYTAGLYVCGNNIVPNGDFETNNPPDDWTYDGSVTASATSDYHTFYQALRLELSSDPTVGASQTVSTDVGATYIYSVWAKVETGQATIKFHPGGDPGTLYTSLSTSSTSYVQLTGLFVSTDTSVLIELIGENPGDVVLFDDLVVAQARDLTDLVTKPTVTGSKGGNEALASLITALVSLGLISDATT